MLTKIKCPICQIDGSISFIEPNYDGPYRCWKCRALLAIEMENNQLKSYEPLSEEELEKLQSIKAIQNKVKRQFKEKYSSK